ncbi:hypothetical protein OEZ85_001761 [Tetradesmus obliquus]|uniref:Right handed beta helix domain-containing protein n=1 Tax=Tetradesmus obliquus TaxID=3088 RepID=A0ABY8U5W7_TETOB|nr:hypothetical protein OEZ85_001761 [Tetradesmus obliquus]
MLLACPLVRSVPVDYVDPQEAEEVSDAAVNDCIVTNYAELKAALEDPAKFNNKCKTGTASAAIFTQCTGKFERDADGPIVLNSGITVWTIKPWCKTKPLGQDIKIDLGKNSNVAVIVAKPTTADTSSSFTLDNINFVFSGSGGSCTSEPCAVVQIDAFRTVTISNTKINAGNSAVAAASIPASGIRINSAETIKLERVGINQVQLDGILVEGGGKVEGKTVKVKGCGGNGLQYKTCASNDVKESLKLEGLPASSFIGNGNAGLLMDCLAAPESNTKAVPVTLSQVTFSKNAKRGMWLRGTFAVNIKKGSVDGNGDKESNICGGGVRVILRNTATVKTGLTVDGTTVKGNKAKYGAGICFQSRSTATVGSPLLPQSLLRLTGNPLVDNNEAKVCGGGLATIANLDTERMAVAIDRGTKWGKNEAEKGKTWCDALEGRDEDDGDFSKFKSIWFTDPSDIVN